jgi:hypothetical protein
MASLKAGDIVVVTKLDRLGRATRELLDLIDRIGKAGASFQSIGDPLWVTSSSQGRLAAELNGHLLRSTSNSQRTRKWAFANVEKLLEDHVKAGPYNELHISSGYWSAASTTRPIQITRTVQIPE